MDLLNQRLIFASMWAFEDIGVQELEDELHHALPQLNLQCEYVSGKEVLVIKGRFDGVIASVTATVSSFIEKQKNKDLLDAPRLRSLFLPISGLDRPIAMESLVIAENEGLLALDDDELIPHPNAQVVKFWLASEGGVGCFAGGRYQDTLSDIAKATGTEISVVDAAKGIRISGKTATDVDDALEKLTRIEKPLLYLTQPSMGNLQLGTDTQGIQLRVQPYTSLPSRRFLADPVSDANSGLGQMFVTVSYTFEEELQAYTPPKNVLEPAACGPDENSRLWNDFTFQEVGDGDDYRAMESNTDDSRFNHAGTELLPSQAATAIHQYLSPEKAKQVSSWIAEGNVGTAVTAKDAVIEVVSSQNINAPISAGLKKTPGIKERRPVQPAQAGPKRDFTEPSAKIQSSEPPLKEDATSTPRKRWKMNYDLGLNNPCEARSLPVESRINAGIHQTSSGQATKLHGQKRQGNPNGPTFDASRYGLKKAPGTKAKGAEKGTEKANPNVPSIRNRSPREQHELIDLFIPDNTSKMPPHPVVGFDAPALVPEPPASSGGARSDSPNSQSVANTDTHISELAGLYIGGSLDRSGSRTSDTSSSNRNVPDQEARLRSLNDEYQNRLANIGTNIAKPRTRPGDVNRMLEKRVIEDYERARRPEAQQSVNETESRRYHRTMSQRTAKPAQKMKDKAALLAKRQATLEDAWGIPKQKKPLRNDLQSPEVPQLECPEKVHASGKEQVAQVNAKQQKDAGISDELSCFITAIRPTLEAAEVFPGILTFEVQFGLVYFPIVPKTCSSGLMSPSEWSKVFQPQTGAAIPTTKFSNRITVSGSDVDHIVDLKTSKAEGKSRLFEQEYSEYGISYELHCRTKSSEILVIAIDELGGYKIQYPSSMLGAVNLHFPDRIWDARAVVGAAAEYRLGANPEFEDTAKYLVDHLWIPPRKKVQIFTRLPEGNKVEIEKVFLKRWTRHRHLPAVKTPKSQAGGEGQDIFLQVTELQDLFMGYDKSFRRARYTETNEMRRRGRTWYEVSLVSPAIETILKANSSLEVGERTDDWRAADLFGDAAASLAEQSSEKPTSSVAAAIGAGGIAHLFRLARTVVEKLDGIGSHNPSSVVSDAPRATGTSSNANNGWDFEDLPSVKEVESVTARVKAVQRDSQEVMREQYERDYW
ncbi:hypothetical protein BJX61DRAFT_540831 [Aspergillus egyptiacus]|nr:hypothetical protein BJX61DRAFT_540831 [Aspergillus egyptiacus]